MQALLNYVPTADAPEAETCYIVDGTLLPCWSWKAHPELYSGKHKTTGMNVQVACIITGRLAWISDPIPGSRVPLQNVVRRLTCRFSGSAHAARWYSLITPPRIFRRCTGASSGTTTGAS